MVAPPNGSGKPDGLDLTRDQRSGRRGIGTLHPSREPFAARTASDDDAPPTEPSRGITV
jgi:hypothetical protein